MENSKRSKLSRLRAKLLKITSDVPTKTPRQHKTKVISRDISHMKDRPAQTPVPGQDLLQVLYTENQMERDLYEPLDKGELPLEKKPLEERFKDALEQFPIIEDSSGLVYFKSETRAIQEQLRAIYTDMDESKHHIPTASHHGEPTGRRQVEFLISWMSAMLDQYIHKQKQPMQLKIEAFQVILKVSLDQLVDQVTVQCHERGQLLKQIISALFSTLPESEVKEQEEEKPLEPEVSAFLQDNSQLQYEMRKLREELFKAEEDLENQKIENSALKENNDVLKKRMEILHTEFQQSNKIVLSYQSCNCKDTIILKRNVFSQTERFFDSANISRKNSQTIYPEELTPEQKDAAIQGENTIYFTPSNHISMSKITGLYSLLISDSLRSQSAKKKTNNFNILSAEDIMVASKSTLPKKKLSIEKTKPLFKPGSKLSQRARSLNMMKTSDRIQSLGKLRDSIFMSIKHQVSNKALSDKCVQANDHLPPVNQSESFLDKSITRAQKRFSLQKTTFTSRTPLTHPGITLFKEFLAKKLFRAEPMITAKQLLKIINKVYTCAIRKEKCDPVSVLYDYLIKIYGLKNVAEKKMKVVVNGCFHHSANFLRVKHFKEFLDNNKEKWNFYLSILQHAYLYMPANTLLNKEISSEHYLIYDNVMLYVEKMFKSKLSETAYNELVEKINEFKIEEESKILMRTVKIAKVDIDLLYSVLIEYQT